MIIAWIAVPFVFIQRIITGKDSVETFKARLGFGAENSANPRLLWLHAASLGEFNTLELLLPSVSEKFANYDLLITVSNKITFEKAKMLRSRSLHVDRVCSQNRFWIFEFVPAKQSARSVPVQP